MERLADVKEKTSVVRVQRSNVAIINSAQKLLCREITSFSFRKERSLDLVVPTLPKWNIVLPHA